MEFMKEMQAFNTWVETNPLEPAAQALWMHLMMISENSGNQEWFSVRNPLLQAKVGISENTLKKHRDILIECGRIEYREKGNRQAGEYRIIPITSSITSNIEVIEDNTSDNTAKFEVIAAEMPEVIGTLNEFLQDNLFKDFKDLKDLNSSATASSTPEETFAKAHERVWRRSLTPFQNDNLGKYIDEENFDEAVIIRAIERAALNGTKYSFGLITKILNDYAASGAKTLAAAKALDEQFSASREVPGRVYPVRESSMSRRQRDLEDLERRRQEAIERERARSNGVAT